MSDYIQIANIRGHQEDYDLNMVKDNFYTLCMKDSKENVGLRKKGMITFSSKDTNIKYLCSDFTRFCLSLFKNNQHIDTGEMTLIPKQPIPISEELKEYIEEFLPDFYEIRK